MMDIFLGFLLVLVCVALCVPIALLIKLTSKGPVLFTQERVGQYGRTFLIYKFRTMRKQGNSGSTWTAEQDARITPVGKWLRLLRLDELPQGFNIVRGDMSLVGPRPEQRSIVLGLESKIPFYNERHMVRPGLTGWSQLHVYAASIEETKLKLEYDLYYIKYKSFLFDMEILLKTAYSVLRGGYR
jgi:lipopolysaccharide/colanic/teichoic acid biosynthesis glycosyltransferase